MNRGPTGILTACLFCLAGQAYAQSSRLDVSPSRIELAGLREGRQLIVTLHADNKPADQTRKAKYRVVPDGVARVSTDGFVRPLAKGEAEVTVEVGGQKQTLHVVVQDANPDRPVDFVNDIEPLLSRHGCNAGGCHGRASGQNGFKLSLLGFEPAEDYEYLVKEGRGRRLMPAVPANSLLLLKATGTVEFNADRMAKILPPVSGQVQSLAVKVGDAVRKNDVLFVLSSRDVARRSPII